MTLPIAIFGFLGDVVDAVVCVMVNIGYAVAWAFCVVINLVIATIGYILAGVVSVLPAVPEGYGSIPESVSGPLNFFLPFDEMYIIFGAFTIAYGIWMVYRIIANWVKAS